MDSISGLALLAIPAGIIGFVAAPCCGLLAPAYIPYAISQQHASCNDNCEDGCSDSTVAVKTHLRRRTVANISMFVLGFTVVFSLLGVSASAVGAFLLENLPLLLNLSGVFVILVGVLILVYGGLSWGARMPSTLDPGKFTGSPIGGVAFGVTFALVWTPCLGPTLGSMLIVAAQGDSLVTGGALLFLYSIGLVIPFILISLGVAGSARISNFIQHHHRAIQSVGGIALITVGVLIVVGGWQGIMADLTGRLAQLGWPPL